MKNFAVHYKNIQAGDLRIFYREAGPENAPVILLMHGYPTSSIMFRNLIPVLSKKYHVIAPDFPGFGFQMRQPAASMNTHSTILREPCKHLLTVLG